MASAAERLARAEARLQVDAFDLGAWEVVLSAADASPLTEGRPLYERFLQQFPCAAVQWKALVESELRARDFVSAEAHLGACLRQCPHLGLWGSYISFVRLATNDDAAKLIEAYELLLDTVGLDVGAVPHWLDYISLLKGKARTEPKLIVRVRGAYQRALVLPLNKLELVWKEYEAWEMLINRTLGRQLVAEWLERHRAARRAGRDRTALRIAAPLDAPGRPPRASDDALVRAWRAFLDYELGGQFRLPAADELARATLALEQALLPLRLHAEVYHLAALHFARESQLDVARAYWARGAHVLPGCALLPLAEAEFEERAGNIDRAANAYERVVQGATSPLAWVHALRFTRRTRGAAAARALFARARRSPSAGWQVYATAALLEASAVPDGAGLGADAAAQIAVNIFEKGLLPHGGELRYVRAYADFLRARARLDELRALFERTLARVDGDGDDGALGAMASDGARRPTAEQIDGLWDAYIELERSTGSVGAARALEERRAARHVSVPEPLSAASLAARFSFGGLLPCSDDEAALLGVDAAALDALSFGDAAPAGARVRAAGAAGAAVGGVAVGRLGGVVAGGGTCANGAGTSASAGVQLDVGGERERRADARPARAGGGRAAAAAATTAADAAGGQQQQGAGTADAPLGEVGAMLLARELNAPEQMMLLLAALPAPAEFAGPAPLPDEVNGLLELLVHLPTNLHALVGTAVRLFGGTMAGGSAAPRAPAACVPGAFVGAGAIEPSGGLVRHAPAAGARSGVESGACAAPTAPSAPPSAPPSASLRVKVEEPSARAAPAAAPMAVVALAPAAHTAAPAPRAHDGSDDSRSEDADEPLARRKRAAGSDLYLQRLQKKQHVRP